MSSGSSGNATLIESDGTRILIDAGLGPRSSATRLRALGEDLFPRGADAIVITHEHGDHAAHLEPMARALGCPVYLHEGIGATRVRRKFPVVSYRRGDSFKVGPLTVRTRKLPHDSPQIAVAVASPLVEFGLVTDLGHVPEDLHEFLAPCDTVLLESNYCPELLELGPYPVRLRQRVKGGVGHLSNEQAATLVRRLEETRVSTVHLGHISRANNTVERALKVVRSNIRTMHVHAIPHGEPRTLNVTPMPKGIHSSTTKRASTQLSLPL